MTYVLNLSHVSLQRGDTQVLSDVSWSTRPRQHWVIVGPNGAGKTTLARVASGRISPDSGEVSLSDTDLANADPAEVATRIGLASAAVAAKIVPTQSVLDTVRSAAWGALSLTTRNTKRSTMSARTRSWRSSASPTWLSASSPPCPRARRSASFWRARS